MFSRALIVPSRSRLSTAVFLHSSAARRADSKASHTTESYNKDEDSSPPPDSKIHRVDPDSDVQKPHEAPSGPYSRVGAESAEYTNTTSEYSSHQNDVRYGGKKHYAEDKAGETSKPDEGPEGKASKGRA